MHEVQAEAPGRVNLIGEHTDYHDGFVLPCAIPQRTRASVHARGGGLIRVWSAQMGGAPVEYELGRERRTGGWGDYVQGVTWALAAAGYDVGGFDLRLRSNVPVGSGLSSSAALEVTVLRALRVAFDLPLTDVQIAQLAHRAEVEFVGAPVGIMDQMASSLAGEHEALFLDARTLAFERISFPDALGLVVIDSGVTHRHAGGEYVARRRESEAAAEQLGVARLRDVSADALPRLSALPPVLARRARHVITENARVLEARAALAAGDLPTFGRLLNLSHASMRDDYEISVPAIDLLVELASSRRDVFGARMTGGGFGGAVVIAATAGAAAAVASQVEREYSRRTGLPATVLVPLAD